MKQFILDHKKAVLIAGFVFTFLIGGVCGSLLDKVHAVGRFKEEASAERFEKRERHRDREMFGKRERPSFEEDERSAATQDSEPSKSENATEEKSGSSDSTTSKDKNSSTEKESV